MAHIHTDPGQYDFTASGFIVRTDFDEPMVMLHWHKKLNKFMQFGGHVELHEDPWQTVTHELLEESGYTLDQLKLLQPRERMGPISDVIVHPQPLAMNTHGFEGLDHYHTDIAFGFITDQPPTHAVAEGESEKMQFFTLSQLQKGEGTIGSNVRDISIFMLEKIINSWEQVDPTQYNST